MDKLDELNLADKTLVIFYSDNGGHGGYATIGGPTGRNITDNAPLRGGKGMLYEGGVRVPLIVRWPATIAAGSVCATPVVGIDFYPTFLELAGATGDPKHELDGVSLAPLLRSSGKKGTLERDAIYWHFPGYLQANVKAGTWRTTPAGSIRSGDHNLIEFFEDGRLEMYDLGSDLGETNDLVETRLELAKRLHRKLLAWRQRVDAPMPKRR